MPQAEDMFLHQRFPTFSILWHTYINKEKIVAYHPLPLPPTNNMAASDTHCPALPLLCTVCVGGAGGGVGGRG